MITKKTASQKSNERRLQKNLIYKGCPSDEQFPSKIMKAIFQRDNYRCIICGNGRHNGFAVHSSYIKPRSKDGQSTIENGQTLCSEHLMELDPIAFMKYSSAGFLKMAKIQKDKKMIVFCTAIKKIADSYE